MNGVEILATEKIASEWIFNWTAFWYAFMGIAILGLLILAVAFATDGFNLPIFFGSLAIILVGSVIAGGAIGSMSSEPTAYKTRYKVTISDEVDMNEFGEQYWIVNQEGKIYTVEEWED